MRSSKKPIVRAEINGKKGYFLVDTGSDISIINTNDLEKYKLEAYASTTDGRRAMGFNGETSVVKKVKNITVVLGEKLEYGKFYSLNLDRIIKGIEAKTTYKISGIIGTDLLMKYNCIIDYNQGNLTFVDSRVKVKIASR